MATTKKKGGLGKGLDSLIIDKNAGSKKSGNTSETNASEGWVNLDIQKVEPNREQPRKQFDEDKLMELSESIKKHGIIEPIVVVKRDDYYQIIAGERRWRASKMAGLKEVPVRIMDLTEEQIVQISLIENIQREDLNPIEEALAYKRLIDEFNYKQDEVAEIVSKSRTVITNSMRLLKLDEKVQQMVIDGTLSSGHARTILSLNDTNQQYTLAERVMDEGLTVRDLEKEIKRINDGEPEKKPKDNIDPKLLAIYGELEEKLKQILGTKVSINPKDNNRGKVEIEYFSQDELDVITDKLMN
ncbi:MAG: ParB/RepB/Spo0J family partition protein [Lachnospiraceae bacterium]|nr:ParB/RepB/Spo0J family partition protein [Lachnospiraceae bacterium]